MRRISTATKVVDKWGPGKPGFTDGNAVTGVPATDLEAAWFDQVQEEIAGAIEAAGIALDSSNRAQLTAAIPELSRRLGLRFSSTSQYASGPITLTAAQAGSFIDLGGAYSGAVTLPALSSVPDGATFYIWSGAAASVTVQRAGTDTIFVNGGTVNSLPLNNGDTLVIGKSGPAGAWVAMWGSAQFPYSAVYAGLAPKPVVGSGVVGQFGTVTGSLNSACTLPSGGTWAYWVLPFNSSGQVSTSSPSPAAGVAAGGSTVGAATSGWFWYGFAWRLQ